MDSHFRINNKGTEIVNSFTEMKWSSSKTNFITWTLLPQVYFVCQLITLNKDGYFHFCVGWKTHGGLRFTVTNVMCEARILLDCYTKNLAPLDLQTAGNNLFINLGRLSLTDAPAYLPEHSSSPDKSHNLRAWSSGFDSWRNLGIFLFDAVSWSALGSPSLLSNGYRGFWG
jgi:hypothetical protein